MKHKQIDRFRGKLAEAIGGRKSAAQFEQKTKGRFRRRTLQNWIDGDTCPTVEQLLDLASESGKDLPFFLGLESRPSRQYQRVLSANEEGAAFDPAPPPEPAPGIPPEIVRVPIVEMSSALTAGQVVNTIRETGFFYFPADFLKKLGATSPDSVEALRAKDDSMAPTIKKGALVIIDYTKNPPAPDNQSVARADDVYAFFLGPAPDVCVKRLRNFESGVHISGDNAEAPPPQLVPNDGLSLRLIGKVIWWDNRL